MICLFKSPASSHVAACEQTLFHLLVGITSICKVNTFSDVLAACISGGDSKEGGSFVKRNDDGKACECFRWKRKQTWSHMGTTDHWSGFGIVVVVVVTSSNDATKLNFQVAFKKAFHCL